MGTKTKRTWFAYWCLNTGKWLFQCQCRRCLPYHAPAAVNPPDAEGSRSA